MAQRLGTIYALIIIEYLQDVGQQSTVRSPCLSVSHIDGTESMLRFGSKIVVDTCIAPSPKSWENSKPEDIQSS